MYSNYEFVPCHLQEREKDKIRVPSNFTSLNYNGIMESADQNVASIWLAQEYHFYKWRYTGISGWGTHLQDSVCSKLLSPVKHLLPHLDCLLNIEFPCFQKSAQPEVEGWENMNCIYISRIEEYAYPPPPLNPKEKREKDHWGVWIQSHDVTTNMRIHCVCCELEYVTTQKPLSFLMWEMNIFQQQGNPTLAYK